MKKVKIALLIFLVFVLILPACKKGANDPFISFKTRKARLTGDWTLKEGAITETDGGSVTIITYDNSKKTVTSGSVPATTAYTENVIINADGSYKIDINDDGVLRTEEGVWYFGGKSKELDLKDKESVVFRETNYTYCIGGSTSTETYTGTECPISSWNIDKLGNKELIIIYDGSSTISSSFSVTGTITFIQ